MACAALTGEDEPVTPEALGARVMVPTEKADEVEDRAGCAVRVAYAVPAGFGFATVNNRVVVLGSGPIGIVVPDAWQCAPVLSVQVICRPSLPNGVPGGGKAVPCRG